MPRGIRPLHNIYTYFHIAVKMAVGFFIHLFDVLPPAHVRKHCFQIENVSHVLSVWQENPRKKHK